MRCDLCGSHTSTVHAELGHNVGMLVLRRTYLTSGDLCAKCLRERFRHHIMMNLLLGWWGTISFVMTWYFLFNNVVVYTTCRRELATLPPPRLPAPPAEPADVRLGRFVHNVRVRLVAGDDVAVIAADLARVTQTTLAESLQFCTGIAEDSFPTQSP